MADGIDPAVPPSGTGCADCLAGEGAGWWFHLRRCAECGHVGCCDSSPSQHARAHAAASGHPYRPELRAGRGLVLVVPRRRLLEGPELAPPVSHPDGPAGSRPRGQACPPTGCASSTEPLRRPVDLDLQLAVGEHRHPNEQPAVPEARDLRLAVGARPVAHRDVDDPRAAAGPRRAAGRSRRTGRSRRSTRGRRRSPRSACGCSAFVPQSVSFTGCPSSALKTSENELVPEQVQEAHRARLEVVDEPRAVRELGAPGRERVDERLAARAAARSGRRRGSISASYRARVERRAAPRRPSRSRSARRRRSRARGGARSGAGSPRASRRSSGPRRRSARSRVPRRRRLLDDPRDHPGLVLRGHDDRDARQVLRLVGAARGARRSTRSGRGAG